MYKGAQVRTLMLQLTDPTLVAGELSGIQGQLEKELGKVTTGVSP